MKKIIGLGNALADILIQIPSDEPLDTLGFGRGSMHLVDRSVHERIAGLTAGLPRTIVSGGSAANTVRGLARLGVPCSYIGKIGRDPVGEHMRDEMNTLGVRPQWLFSGTPTGRCKVLVSPDGERTMATFLGAAVELTDPEITPEMLADYDLLHVEGYLVQNHELIRGAVRKARQAGLAVSLDMASYNVVEENRDFLHELIAGVDIVFANEEEARVFTGLEPDEAALQLAKMCDTAVVKVGERGSRIARGGRLIPVEAVSAEVVDTTGAGDLYATGFLYGWCRGLPLAESGAIGSLVAAQAIAAIGPTFTEEGLEKIRAKLSEPGYL
jgi:sugar/nucleoside kinase (ribokinase family)